MKHPATNQQEAAIDARDRDVLLEAGAGTGKTRVLVDRYCDAITVDEIGLDEILAFTFTDRAAAQLRHRIRRELRRRGEGQLARDTETAWISTIHGFCQRLIGAHPVALGLDPRYGVLDQGAAERVAGRAFSLALGDFLADGTASRRALVAAHGVFPLRKLIISAHDELRSRGMREPALPPLSQPDGTALPLLVQAAAAALAVTTGATGSAAKTQQPKLEEAAALGANGAATLDRLEELKISSSSPAYKVPEVDSYNAAVTALCSELQRTEYRGTYEDLRALLGIFATRYAELKDDRSRLDFEDLQLEAVRLLREVEGVAAAAHERFRHILVDEFQDTNRLQLELLALLRGPQTKVFTVGDEFQSIYGFRHADLEVFRGERARLEALPDTDALVLPLTGNFRSTEPVLKAINWVGKSLLPDFRPLTPGVPEPGDGDGAPAAELLLTPFATGEHNPWVANGNGDKFNLKRPGDDPTKEHQVAEARLLAARLREILEEEPGLERSDVVLLLRSFRHVGAFEDELQRAGLRPYVVGGRGYWSQQQVDDVRRLLGAIENPLDDLSLLGALSAPFCGVLPDTLYVLRQAADEEWRHIWPVIDHQFADGAEPEGFAALIPAEDAQKLREFRTVLRALRETAPLLALEELVDSAVTAFDYDLAALSRPAGPRRLANIRKLMRLARDYEASEGRDLRGFLAFLEDRATGFESSEGQAATEAEAHDGVRVMTVHAAKGLEFPVVAVGDLGRKLTFWPAKVLVGAGPEEEARVGIELARIARKGIQLFDYATLRDEAAAAEAEEECRLAYVAASRAEKRLVLSGCYSESWDAKPVDDRPLGTPISERLMQARDAAPASLAITINEPDPAAFAARTKAVESGAADPEPPQPLAERVPTDPPEPAASKLSYSSIATYDNCAYRFYVERVLGLGDAFAAGGDAGRRGRAFGNAVHSILEHTVRSGWKEPDAEVITARLAAEGLTSSSDLARAQEMVSGWLASELCKRVQAASAVRAEIPFLLPAGGALIRGKIDLLADLDDGTRLVIDYKTDQLSGMDPADVMERYLKQRSIYALAATGSEGAAIESSYVFLERPNEPLITSMSQPDLEEARAELDELIGRIESGDFTPTDQPHAGLCRDCPAQKVLCSQPPELTLRESAG